MPKFYCRGVNLFKLMGRDKLDKAFEEFFKQISFSLKDDLSEMQRMWMNLRAEELKNEILYYIIENGRSTIRK